MQARREIEEYLDNSLVNKLIKSPTPDICLKDQCILGIDEAGRGPVLGPMVYGIAYFPKSHEDLLSKMKFADSKELSESAREKLFESFQSQETGFDKLGYVIKVISPNMISNVMLRRKKYNLNALSHDTAIELIKTVEALKVPVDHVYIDTVGPAIKYKEKLQKFFPNLRFTVAEKADSKYPIVSAASVCAKVVRDRIVQNWRFAEAPSLHLEVHSLGSGYPADPGTKKFLEDSVDPIFGFSTLVRFSWSTITKALDKNAYKCDWNDPDDDEEDPKVLQKQKAHFMKFFKPAPKATQKATSSRSAQKSRTNADSFFEERCLTRQLRLV